MQQVIPYAFGGDRATGLKPDLDEPSRFLRLLESLDARWICTTAGTPYYNPHLLRPAAFPPSDGYLPPEDPLVGVARQIQATAFLKHQHPNMILVGSAYLVSSGGLPKVAQRTIRDGRADFVGIGRMVLSYPEFPRRRFVAAGFSNASRSAEPLATAPRDQEKD